MCGKVKIANEGTAHSTCYTEFQNGREIEVCVCESQAGQRPCNHAAGAGGGADAVALLSLMAAALTTVLAVGQCLYTIE